MKNNQIAYLSATSKSLSDVLADFIIGIKSLITRLCSPQSRRANPECVSYRRNRIKSRMLSELHIPLA